MLCVCLQLLDELTAHVQDPQARFLRDFLSTAAPALTHNGNQLYSQMSLYQPAADRYRAQMDAPPVQTLMSLVPKAAATTPDDLHGGARSFDLVKRFNDDSNFVITVSTERKEISVWDVHK